MSTSMVENIVRFRGGKEPRITPHQEMMHKRYLEEKVLARPFTGKGTEHVLRSAGEGIYCCTVCGGLEAGMTDKCPGFTMNRIESELVYWTYCNGPNSGRMQLPTFEDYNAVAEQWNNEILDHHNEDQVKEEG